MEPTRKMTPRPVMLRAMRRYAGHSLPPPTEREQQDAILILAEGPVEIDPRDDPLYAEAERIFAEASVT